VRLALVAGRDYPRSYREFVEMFHDDEACAAYLEQLRWSSGFICPACGRAADPWRQTRGRSVCTACRHQTSATSGTILDKTRTPLTTWFEAAWHLTTAKNGLSAKTLERTLGTSYRTAWAMLQRYRVAMVRSERERLSGTVEVDESLVGGVEHGGKRGRGTGKPTVVIAVEVKEPKGFGRVRMRHIPGASGANLARISHQLSATTGDVSHPAVFSRLGVLDVPQVRAPRPSGRELHWARHLAALATKPGEICGLVSCQQSSVG